MACIDKRHQPHYHDLALMDNLHPRKLAPESGIYKCQTCGHETVAFKGHPLPPEHAFKHDDGMPTLWCLVASAQQVHPDL